MSFQNYFVYKNVAYGIGTTVKISQSANFSIVGASGTNIKNINEVKNKTYTFTGGTTNGEFIFKWREFDDDLDMMYGIRCQVTLSDVDAHILQIINPIEVQLVSWQKNAINNMFSKDACVDVFGGVLTYIVIMCIGTIFKGNWIIWLVSTIVFVWWLLNQYRN